jgi:phosphatidate cytidylyltransferase
MSSERVILALVLLPFVFWAIAAGGWLFYLGVAVALSLAVMEFAVIFRTHGHRPALPLMVLGILMLSLARFLFAFEHSALLLTALLCGSIIWHVIDFERGAEKAGTDAALTIAGLVYIGWIGSYLISLRELPQGKWWMLIALPSVWFADMAAYYLGRAFGRHRLAPRLSPKKTWEGYLSGIAAGGLSAWLLSALWRIAAGPGSGLEGGGVILLGALLGAFAPIGDLGISMIKREFKIKDSGWILPGHGGALDRIDSWLWGGALGFYMIRLMMAT